jgi:hypothetical protein
MLLQVHASRPNEGYHSVFLVVACLLGAKIFADSVIYYVCMLQGPV